MKYSLEEIELIIGTVVGFITIIYFAYKGLKKFVLQRLKKSKIKRLYFLINDWFNEIDVHIDDLNLNSIHNKENKISDYIDQSLKYTIIKIRLIDRVKFLKYCGIKKELRNNKRLFERYSRINSDKLFISNIWYLIMGNFYNFYRNYNSNSNISNFADVEMPIKFLKQYLKIKK